MKTRTAARFRAQRIRVVVAAAVTIVGLIGSLSNCTTDVPSDASEGQRGDSITSGGQAGWSARSTWQIDPQPFLTIGEENGPVEYTFGSIRGATRFADGRIAIADNSTKDIRFFDGRGNHLKSVGRSGEGPGEYRTLSALARSPHDTLLIADGTLRRVTILDPQGDYARSFQIEGVPATDRLRKIAAIDDQYALVLAYAGISDFMRPDGMSGYPVNVWVVDLHSAVAQVVGQMDSEQIIVQKHGERRSSSRVAPFATPGHAAAGAGLVVMGSSATDAIELYAADGRRLGGLDAVRPMPAVQPGEIRRYYLAAQPGRDLDLLFRRTGFENVAPPRMPAFDDLIVDPDSDVWVRRYAPPWDSTLSRWDVHDRRGVWLGTVTAPTRRPVDTSKKDVLEVGRDYVLILLMDSLGVQRVGAYRLRKPRGE